VAVTPINFLRATGVNLGFCGFATASFAVLAGVFGIVPEDCSGRKHCETSALFRAFFLFDSDNFSFDFHSYCSDRFGQFRKKESESNICTQWRTSWSQHECSLFTNVSAGSAACAISILMSPPKIHPRLNWVSHIRPLSGLILSRRASPFGRSKFVSEVRSAAHVGYLLATEATTLETKPQEYESHFSKD
jgi:hypothetical protein